MAKLNGKTIRDLAKQIVSGSPGGIRYSELVRQIAGPNPETPINTIHGSVWDLDAKFPNEIKKPSRGIYQPVDGGAVVPVTKPESKEEDFYEPFAEYLKNDLDEVTVAAPLGGSGLKTKWGTPDVVGVYKPLARHRIKFDVEIVSAEVKIDSNAPVVAFGQAVAYRLFSAKSYVVMPNTLSEEDKSRLESLCLLFGIGLVFFDVDVNSPNFSIRVRAQRFSPDMFYVNDFADRLFHHDPSVFDRLFG